MNLNNRFVAYLTEKTGASADATYLLAVSGGVDSMVMVHLFAEARLSFAVAHCNFSLRGEESNLDNQLVKTYCSELNIPFYDIVVDTQKIARAERLSIQETARNIRYTWFQQLLQERGYDFIVTAHHRDDNAETVLFNLIRGTGLKGLKGIPLQNNSVIRPLLFAGKEELIEYADEHQIPYRNDASNTKDTYARNKIRNKVIPILKEVNAEAVKHIHQMSEYSYAISFIVEQHMEQLRSQIVEQKIQQTIINCSDIIQHPFATFYLYELLAPYGYNASQITAVYNVLKAAKSGGQFFSPSHTLTINRGQIIVQQTLAIANAGIILEKSDYTEFCVGLNTYTASIEPAQHVQQYEAGILYMDADLVSFPLIIRKWENGDFFSPLGMKGKKKISDFLIDKKVSLPDKENTFVITSDNNIIAVLNYQIDEGVKATSHTQHLLQISVQKKRGTE